MPLQQLSSKLAGLESRLQPAERRLVAARRDVLNPPVHTSPAGAGFGPCHYPNLRGQMIGILLFDAICGIVHCFENPYGVLGDDQPIQSIASPLWVITPALRR